jgi:MoxR-like ATPase
MFGFDPARTILSAPAETERSFWGRRYQVQGGTWRLRPSPVLSYPLLVLDELDKASPATQRAALKLLQGETRVLGEEGELVEVAPVVLVLSNSALDLIPPEYRRRCVVLTWIRWPTRSTNLATLDQRHVASLEPSRF